MSWFNIKKMGLNFFWGAWLFVFSFCLGVCCCVGTLFPLALAEISVDDYKHPVSDMSN